MLIMNTIQPNIGARKYRDRVGRGCGSGSGCTAGYGNNGAKARSGNKYKAYFEGGQTPLSRRTPKRGFNNKVFRTRYQIVNLSIIEKKCGTDKDITIDWLFDKGLITDKNGAVKVLGNGDITKPFTIHAHTFSKSAKEKIEKAKGKLEVLKRA